MCECARHVGAGGRGGIHPIYLLLESRSQCVRHFGLVGAGVGVNPVYLLLESARQCARHVGAGGCTGINPIYLLLESCGQCARHVGAGGRGHQPNLSAARIQRLMCDDRRVRRAGASNQFICCLNPAANVRGTSCPAGGAGASTQFLSAA